MIVLIEKFFRLFKNDYRQQFFRDDNIFSFAKNDFSSSCKTFFACFSIIFKTDCDDKLRKRTTDWANFKKINRTIREDDVNILKTFINDFLNDVVIFLLNNEIERMLELNTYSSSEKMIFETFSINCSSFRLSSTSFNFDEINVV